MTCGSRTSGRRFVEFLTVMINKCVSGIVAIVLMCAANIAAAAPITWGPDTYDPTNDVYFADGGAACTFDNLSTTCESLAYIHDLTLYGFIPGASSDDQIIDGLLEIVLRDDENDRPSEGFKITLNGLLQPGTEPAAVPFSFNDISGSLLASLQADGLLNVTLSHQHGDFIFDRSTFIANGTRESESPTSGSDDQPTTTAVPEPASIALLSAGFFGLIVRRRSTKR